VLRKRKGLDFLSSAALRWFIIILAPIVLGLLSVTKNFYGLTDRSALDMAQVARNLARTGHYTTQSIRPLSLVYKATTDDHPDLYNEPLWPFVLSNVFRIWRAADKPVAATGMVLWLATVWLTLGLARRLFSWRVTALAAVLLACNVTVLPVSVSGTNAMLATLLVLLMLWALYRRETRQDEGARAAAQPLPLWRLGVAGALLGLGTLTMYPLAVLAIPVVIYAATDRRPIRLLRPAIVLAGMILVLLPWLIRNQVVAGSPFSTLHAFDVAGGTQTYPGQSVFRSMDPDTARNALPLAFMWRHLGEVLAKAKATVFGLPGVALGAVGPLVVVFFFFSMFQQPQDRGLVRLRRCFFGMFIAHVMILALTRSRASDLLIYAPLGTILAAAGMARLIGAIDLTSIRQGWQAHEWRLGAVALGRLLTLAVLVGVAIWPFGQWLRGRSYAPLVASFQGWYTWLKPTAGGAPLLMSDVPEAVAWYCDLPAVWLTRSSLDYDRLVVKVRPVGILHFLAPPLAQARAEGASWWWTAYSSPAPYKGLVQRGPGRPDRPDLGLDRECRRSLPSLTLPLPVTQSATRGPQT